MSAANHHCVMTGTLAVMAWLLGTVSQGVGGQAPHPNLFLIFPDSMF